MEMVKKFLFAALAITLSSACGTFPVVHNVKASPIFGVDNHSLKYVEESILDIQNRNKYWTMQVAKPGHIVASFKYEELRATVDITFNTKEYNIIYKNSENLDYDGQRINARYNRWVLKLERNIRSALQKRHKTLNQNQ